MFEPSRGISSWSLEQPADAGLGRRQQRPTSLAEFSGGQGKGIEGALTKTVIFGVR